MARWATKAQVPQTITTLNQCRFCGSGDNLTGEDLIPKWANEELKAQSGGKLDVLFSTRQIENNGNVLQSANRRRQTYSAVKVPGYCGPCNNAWMSQVESRVRPLVIAMMRGERVGFSKIDLEALALWLCIKTLVADSEDHGYVTFTPNDFRWVYENKAPAERFIARVGRYEHPERTRCQFQVSPITAAQALGGMRVNDPLCVEFHLVFGKVWFACAMMRRDAHDYPLPWGSVVDPHWTLLWPIASSNVNWPPPSSFTPEQLPESLRVWPEADEWLERKGVKWAAETTADSIPNS